MRTYLVLTGSTEREEIFKYPYRPTKVFDSIADMVDML